MRRAHTRACISLAILLACCACAFALDPSLDLSQYSHTAWKVRDGFAKGYIASIAQTPDGYLWLGTEFGSVRFDGVRPVPWQPPGNQHLPPGTIFSLLAARRDGTLWIGATGLASWKDGELTQYPEFANQFIFALFEDSVGDVWVGSAGIPTGKLCSIHQGSVHCYSPDGGFGIGVFALYEDSKGNLWAGVKDGLWRWNHGHPEFYSLPGERNGIRALAEDTDGALLVGWKGSIYRFADGKTEAYSLAGKLGQFRANRILHDRNGGLWIGTTGRGVLHIHEGKTDVLLSSDGLSGDEVAAVFEDREGNIWISTLGGLDQFRDSAAATFTVKQGLSKDVVVSVLANKYGSVWLATRDGLNQWEQGQITILRTGGAKRDGTLNGFQPNSLFQDDRGRIWVSTSRELGYLENGRFTSIKGVPGGDMLSITQDTAANVWVAHEHVGLFRISHENDVREIPWASLGHKDHASVLAADRRRGGLWIGFFLGGIVYFADGQVRTSYTAADGLGAGRVGDFQFDDEGTLWVSTEGGLSRLKNNRVATLTSKNGLPCDTVHWAIEDDDDHSMWLYTACGLVRIAHSELYAWAAAVDKGQGTNRAVQVTVFDRSDGVRSLSSPGYYHPQVAKTPDGKLWFLPWDGVSVIDPHHIPFNKIPPPVNIEQIVADRMTYDTASDTTGNLRLPPLIRDLEIDYTALSLVAPEKIRFRYKLEGLGRGLARSGQPSAGVLHESPSAPLSISSRRLQQQWGMERGRRVSGLRDCARLLPDELVPRAVCAHVSGDALDRLSASRPRFGAAPGRLRTTPDRDSRAERTVDQSAGGGADAHLRRAARRRSPADHLPYSQARQGEDVRCHPIRRRRQRSLVCSKNSSRSERTSVIYRMSFTLHCCKRRACPRPCRRIARSSARYAASRCRVRRTRV